LVEARFPSRGRECFNISNWVAEISSEGWDLNWNKLFPIACGWARLFVSEGVASVNNGWWISTGSGWCIRTVSV